MHHSEGERERERERERGEEDDEQREEKREEKRKKSLAASTIGSLTCNGARSSRKQHIAYLSSSPPCSSSSPSLNDRSSCRHFKCSLHLSGQTDYQSYSSTQPKQQQQRPPPLTRWISLEQWTKSTFFIFSRWSKHRLWSIRRVRWKRLPSVIRSIHAEDPHWSAFSLGWRTKFLFSFASVRGSDWKWRRIVYANVPPSLS